MKSYTTLAKLYDGFSLDAAPQEWAEYVSGLLKLKKVANSGEVADIGCGTGAVTLELYKKGYRMLAADNSPEMLEIAAQRFSNSGARVQVVNQDMRNLNLAHKVDAAVCVNDGINYILDKEDIAKTFKAVYGSLKPGGVFLFDISSVYKLKSMDNDSFFEETDDALYIWHNDYDDNNDILTMEISLYSHYEDDLYQKSLETHRQKAHKADELILALDEVGFCDINTYDCFSFNDPSETSNRIQFSAVK